MKFNGCAMQRSTLVLLFCCSSLSAVVYYEATYDSRPHGLPALPEKNYEQAQSLDRAVAANIHHDFPSISQFHEVKSRPLFNPSRRPNKSEPLTPMQTYQLRGTALSQGRSIAILSARFSGLVVRVSEGGFLDGWLVASVGPDAIELIAGEQYQRMEILQARADDAASLSEEFAVLDDAGGTYDESEHGMDPTISTIPDRPDRNADHIFPERNEDDHVVEDAYLSYGPILPAELLPPPPPPLRIRRGNPSAGTTRG